MILQVGADARHVGDHVDAVRAQQLGRSEPGKLQQLRRVERAAGQDDLAAGAGSLRRAALPVFDPDRAPPLEQDAARQRVGFDDEIGPAARLAQIADRRRPAPAVLRRELEIAGAFLRRPVEIVVARIARLLRGVDERLAQRMRLADIGDRERPADAVQLVLAALLVLGAAEVRQHVVEAPAGIAELPPVIVVRRLAAQIEQAVDRARAAQHLAARLDDLAVVELGLRLGLVEPVDPCVGEQLAVAERDVDPEVAIVAAGLQQQHAMAARGGQAVGQHAAGGTGADDDVVERVCVGHGCHNGYSILTSGKVQRQIERGLGRGEQIR